MLAIAVCLAGISLAAARDFVRSRAIVVGIDGYDGGTWQRLSHAVADARRVAEFLQAQGYEVVLLTDGSASREAILDALHAAARELSENDRLLFYFGGHGHTQALGEEEAGYLVPAGARSVGGMISMEEIRSISQLMRPVRHQLFVLNACYGGSIGILRGGRALSPQQPGYLDQIVSRQARQFIAAGGPDQQVLDGGPAGLSWFTHFFLEAAEGGAADLDGDGAITFPELSAFLLPRASNSVQTPSFGALPGHALGEYVFTRAGGTGRIVVPDVIEPPMATTRGGAMPEATQNFEAMQQPVHDLFAAWAELDLDGYLNQWSPDAVQFVGRKRRGFADIAAQRRSLFPRLSAVEVRRYQLWFRGFEDGVASFDASYDMAFHFRDGRTVTERERETYRIARERGRWVIVENRDYVR